MRQPWELYDDLIGGIPDTVRAADCQVGVSWTMVRSDRGGAGLAHTIRETGRPFSYEGELRGAPLRDLARCVKSWNLLEASLGMAAINAWYNTEAALNRPGISRGEAHNAFDALAAQMQGKKVAVVGHFPDIEHKLKPICRLTVLERNPQPGDFPDGACEYLLPEQDFVFLTGMTLVNKTLPRLLELSAGCARVSLVGPSVPLTDRLQRYGIDDVSGFCVTDAEAAAKIVLRGGKREIFRSGEKWEFCFQPG